MSSGTDARWELYAPATLPPRENAVPIANRKVHPTLFLHGDRS